MNLVSWLFDFQSITYACGIIRTKLTLRDQDATLSFAGWYTRTWCPTDQTSTVLILERLVADTVTMTRRMMERLPRIITQIILLAI